MRRLLGMMAAACSLGNGALADSHGWEPLRPMIDVPAGTGALFARDDIEFLGMVEVEGRVVTHWMRPSYIDETQTDFLGNPLQVMAEVFRCYEALSPSGSLTLEFCELAR